MENTKSLPVVVFFAEHSPFSLLLAKEFVESGCYVVVVTENTKEWQMPGLGLVNTEILPYSSIGSISDPDYVFLLDLTSTDRKPHLPDKFYNKIESVYLVSKKLQVKTCYAFSSNIKSSLHEKLSVRADELTKDRDTYAAVLYLGDPVTENSFADDCSLLKAHIRGRIVLSDDTSCFVVDAESACKEVIRSTFSLKAYGRKTSIFSSFVNTNELNSVAGEAGAHRETFNTESVDLVNFQSDYQITTPFNKEKFLINLSSFAKHHNRKTVNNSEEHSAYEDFDLKQGETIPRLSKQGTSFSGFSKANNTGGETDGVETNNNDLNIRGVDVYENVPTTTPLSAHVPNYSSFAHIQEVKSGFFKKWQKTYKDKAEVLSRAFGNLNRKIRRTLTKKVSSVHRPSSSKRLLIPTLRNKTVSLQKLFHFKFVRLAVVAFVVLPLFLLLVSYASLVFAQNLYHSGNVAYARAALKTSYFSSNAAYRYTSTLAGSPVGFFYKGLASTFFVMNKTASVGEKALDVYSELSGFSGAVFNNNSPDFNRLTQQISLDLYHLYSELGFLEGEVKMLFDKSNGLINIPLGKIASSDSRKAVLGASKVFNVLPNMLGKEKPATYMILLQNNLHKRATGGIIEAVGVVSFSSGKLIDYNVYSVDYLDSRLMGHVEPPSPIKDYLGQNKWSIKHSNWDPDFAISAAQAQWFLDKQLDISVDGVIGIDLEVIRKFLRGGSLYVPGYPEVTYDNLYSTTEELSSTLYRSEYFVGLTEAFIEKIRESSLKNIANYTLAVAQGLEEKNIQVYFNDEDTQKIFDDLNWSGTLSINKCRGNCYDDFLSIVEVSLQGDGSASGIRRHADLNISIEEGIVKRRLVVYMENPASNLSEYQTYLRILVPQESGLGEVGVFGQVQKTESKTEIFGLRNLKEAGVFISIPRGESKAINLTWESAIETDFNKKGSYNLSVKKQAGTAGFPLKASVQFPEEMQITTFPTFSLTNASEFSYNSDLARDFFWQANW
jgi:hypothetical protein